MFTPIVELSQNRKTSAIEWSGYELCAWSSPTAFTSRNFWLINF